MRILPYRIATIEPTKKYASPESLPRLAASEYLDWETRQDIRHELVDGYFYGMIGASLRHDEIAMNLAAALHSHLKNTQCRVYKSAIKVQLANNFLLSGYRHSCGDSQSVVSEFSLTDPKVIVAVLSPST